MGLGILKKRILGGLTALLVLIMVMAHEGCAPFVDSPFSDQVLTKVRDMNATSISRLTNVEGDSMIRIAMIADVHQNYVDLDKVIYEINQTPGIDFIANLGDFTNSGYNLEYDQFMDSYTSFRAPAVTAIGNHDAIGSGPEIFHKVFGELNFWFESPTYRYIFFDSANLESAEAFHPDWLKSAVDSSTKSVIIFTHCSLQDPERFTGGLATQFNQIINDSKVKLILNGHNHTYSLTDVSGTTLLQIPRVQGVSWVLLEIQGNQLTITRKIDGFQEVVTLKP